MPAKRLTKESVLRLQCKSAPYQVQDVRTDTVPGLSVLVNPSGVRSYHDARQALVLGRVGEMTLEEARKWHRVCAPSPARRLQLGRSK